MLSALGQLAPNDTARRRALAWSESRGVPENDEVRFLRDIRAIGKGRYAQRLAAIMLKEGSGPQAPKYIVDAITYIGNRLGHP